MNSTHSPRIVVVGGSGVCFDLRSDLVEQELPGYEAVNFGLYAGLGTTVMLDLCLPQLREGDILIFAPEVNEQTYSTWFGSESMWQACGGAPGLLWALPASCRGVMLGAFPDYASEKARLFSQKRTPEGDGVYARASFNTYGDIACPGHEQNIMPGGWDQNMPLLFDPELATEEFVRAVNSAAEACEQRGVRFYFRYCPMNAAAIPAGQAEQIRPFADAMEAKLSCRILGDIEDAILAPQWFFDTIFHLNDAGAITATALLTRDLKAELGLTSPSGISLPEMPALADAALVAGDARDEACFVYEETEGGYLILALTETGRQRDELTVPVSHRGQPGADLVCAVGRGLQHGII